MMNEFEHSRHTVEDPLVAVGKPSQLGIHATKTRDSSLSTLSLTVSHQSGVSQSVSVRLRIAYP